MAKFKDQEGVYHLQFNKELDNNWYIDFPGWPFSHHNLMMVAGADDLCEAFNFNNKAKVLVSTECGKFNVNYKRVNSSLLGGATYELYGIVHKDLPKTIWLCPVTLAVMGNYPEYLSIENDYECLFPPQIEEVSDIPIQFVKSVIVNHQELEQFTPKDLSCNFKIVFDDDSVLDIGEPCMLPVRNFFYAKPYLFKKTTYLNK